jgi:tetratricopeptide (TPR) repeat protein
MPAFARAQDSLARAKDFYAAAAYEEALVVLQRLNAANPGTDRNEVAAYQAFCLVALGRSEEARKTIESLVRMDPLYKLSEAQASPRVRAFFDDVRRPLLPEIVKQTYSRAKDAYDRKELTSAATEFDRAIALIDEVGSANDRALADLRTLASGFRDLAKAAAAPPPPPPPPAAATEGSTGNASTAANGTAAGGTTGATNGNAGGTSAAPGPSGVKTPPAAPAAPESEPTYGPRDTDVTRPVAVKRTMPEWRPSLVEAMIEFNGSLELLIGTDGKVLSAAITDSIHPGYDTQLKQAALGWSFRPATKGGKPVRYRYALDIQLKK